MQTNPKMNREAQPDYRKMDAGEFSTALGMDGKKWADAFCQYNNCADHAMMLGWFCNAIMAGYDTARNEAAALTPTPSAEIEQVKRDTYQSLLNPLIFWYSAHGNKNALLEAEGHIAEILALIQPQQAGEDAIKEAEKRGCTIGIAIATANAVRQETWYPDELLGGVTVADMMEAGVEEYDIEPIERELKERGRDDQAKRIKVKKAKPVPPQPNPQPSGEDVRQCLQWFVDRQHSIQAKYDLHGPSDTAEAMRENYKKAKAALASQPSGDMRAAFEELLAFAESQICTHDNTYRGGVLWEICEDCGRKWADDEGGKPKFEWPKAIVEARKALAAWQAAQGGK